MRRRRVAVARPVVGFPIERLTIGAGAPAGGGRATQAGAPAASAGEQVNFAFNVRVDRRDEWKQILDESYRVMKYRYYDPQMHGKDWAAIYARYSPLLKYAGTNEDVYDIANAMIGELSSSHTGVSGPSSVNVPRAYTTRYLGFEMEPANGKYRVTHVYRDGPADKDWIDISNGDYVLSIDGQDVKAGDDYWKILSQTENEYVPVKVSKTADGANAKTFRIATVTNLTNIKYEEWVENNRDSVDKATQWRDRVRAHSRDGSAVARALPERDRPLLAEEGHHRRHPEQRRRQHRPGAARHSRAAAIPVLEQPQRIAHLGTPAASGHRRTEGDDDELSLGVRRRGHAGRLQAARARPVVGNPTSAQVIATGSYNLINGGTIRTPGSLVVTWDPSKPNNYGVDLENYGVPPDVWVKNSPADDAKGFDHELKVAIEEALKMLKAAPKVAMDKQNRSRAAPLPFAPGAGQTSESLSRRAHSDEQLQETQRR